MILRVYVELSSVILRQVYEKEQAFGGFYSFEGREKNFKKGRK